MHGRSRKRQDKKTDIKTAVIQFLISTTSAIVAEIIIKHFKL